MNRVALVVAGGLLLAGCGAVAQGAGTDAGSGPKPPEQGGGSPTASSGFTSGSGGGTSVTTTADAGSTTTATDAGSGSNAACSALSACCDSLTTTGRASCNAAVASRDATECASYLSGVQAAGACGDAGAVASSDAGGLDATFSTDAESHGDVANIPDASIDIGPSPGLDSGVLTSFDFSLGGTAQTPLNCPSADWEFTSSSGTAILKNTGPVPLAYLTETNVWYGGAQYIPDVPTGSPGELVGVIAPGAQANISGFNTYVLLGSSLPFSVQGDRTIQDEGTIPWPAGVPGSGGATVMQLAQMDIDNSCRPVAPLWL
jgi:hypothetical protein